MEKSGRVGRGARGGKRKRKWPRVGDRETLENF